MKVVHISTWDVSGGAARAAYRLHRGLQMLGHDSSMMVANRTVQDSDVIEFAAPNSWGMRLRRLIRRHSIDHGFAPYRMRRPPGSEYFSDDRTPYDAGVVEQIPLCDVVNLHWIAGFIDYQTFFSTFPRSTPLVWTLHDMNPMTGGCHYDDQCGKYKRSCGACPQLRSTDDKDLSHKIWMRKEEAFRSRGSGNLHLVVPCRWLESEVKQSPLLSRFSVSVIPYGIDLQEFAPRDRRAARDVLGIPQQSHVVLFVSDHINNRRKGAALMIQALSGIQADLDLLMVSVGRGRAPFQDHLPSMHLGQVDTRWLSLVYSAADVFVLPSTQDNLPNTVLESMACGTPVVAFEVGGIPDMVTHEQTGLLVAPFDPAGLKDAVVRMLKHREMREEMSGRCRRRALEEYSSERQAQRYAELYKSFL